MEDNIVPNKEVNAENKNDQNSNNDKKIIDTSTISLDNSTKEITKSINNENSKKSIDQKNNVKDDSTEINKNVIKPKKELPVEKKPFDEFVNSYLIPTLVNEFKTRGFEIEDINLKNTIRPIAGDKCWVIYCQIKNTCDFWLSFEKDDISSTKSISLSKPYQKPSIIESFLIDEKRITLNLIISRIFQRLNGQKLIGVN